MKARIEFEQPIRSGPRCLGGYHGGTVAGESRPVIAWIAPTTAAAAWSVRSTDHYDLVIRDVMLPVLDGLTLLQQLRRR